jgi:hypothetical protein
MSQVKKAVDMNDLIFIVSGTYEQYKQWVKNNIDRYYSKNTSITLSNFVYVSGPEIFRGHSKVHGVFTGTYLNRPDINEIVQMITMINNR